MLKKTRGGYKAVSSRGRALSKKPKTKSAAIKQLIAVEYSKARAAGKKKPSAKLIKKAFTKKK